MYFIRIACHRPEKPGKIKEIKIGYGKSGKVSEENIKENKILNFVHNSLKLLLLQIIFIIF